MKYTEGVALAWECQMSNQVTNAQLSTQLKPAIVMENTAMLNVRNTISSEVLLPVDYIVYLLICYQLRSVSTSKDYVLI